MQFSLGEKNESLKLYFGIQNIQNYKTKELKMSVKYFGYSNLQEEKLCRVKLGLKAYLQSKTN